MTATEYLKQKNFTNFVIGYASGNKTVTQMMVEFAKFHVQEALKAASKLDFESITHPEANDYEQAVEMTILECYSPKNIK